MPALRDKDGNVIGTMDGPGRGIPIAGCQKSSFFRVACGCQAFKEARAMDAAQKQGKRVGFICNKWPHEREAINCDNKRS